MRLRILSLLMFLSAALPAAAQDTNILCLQNQLTVSGYDAGPPDGLIGRKTRRALTGFLRDRGLDATMPLTTANASALCRKLALAEPELKRFWPSAESALEIVIAEDVNTSVARVTQSFALTIHSDLSTRFDVELAGTDYLVVATSPTDLRRMISDHTGIELVGLSANLQDSCNSFRNMSGRAAPNLVYVCVNPDAKLGSDIAMDWLKFFLAHEFTHLLQFQINGTLPVDGYSDQQRVDFEGPMWLTEGLAQVVANVVATGAEEAVYRDIMISRYEGKQIPDPANLENRRALERRRSDVYRVGTIAATDLVEAHGYASIGALYDDLANGVPWADAFHARFGLTVEAFYDQFSDRYR